MKADLKSQSKLDNIITFKKCRKGIDVSKKETGISKNQLPPKIIDHSPEGTVESVLFY